MAGRCDAKDLPDYLKSMIAPPLPSTENNNDVDFQLCWDLDSNFGGPDLCNSNGRFVRLQPQQSPGLNNMNLFGPEIALAHALAPRLTNVEDVVIKRVFFIKYALGSTNLHTNWSPSNSVSRGKMAEIGYYQHFMNFCKESLQSLGNDVNVKRPLCGLFWLQGESDSSKAKTANSYLDNFKSFIQSVREDLDYPDLPVVCSPVIWPNGKKVHVVNEALRQAGEEVSNCRCIEALAKDEFGVQGDDAGVCAGHLTGVGLCEIGRRMGEAIPLDVGGMNLC
mmetsp:Transcript_6108/g.10955  ORF Transcript_6108/g.10955 Transcript_6108/m.10955 type:complete len:279 (-) Transcript_6108:214-1050(-)|eukprot:CAMPEP_0183759850 /NCGR_PEP_ID=MMETSP0739-20130205/7348_1 /TAXON_ID=385413 /ORGANISM="Thalassiosira miniscula, Strain CCMP1093" /LENGTH=278 /DNA_ID=CAMNT_0025997693 /DNA_START=136 /DNA_END=972 /DNA_ORIENTATION=-